MTLFIILAELALGKLSAGIGAGMAALAQELELVKLGLQLWKPLLASPKQMLIFGRV